MEVTSLARFFSFTEILKSYFLGQGISFNNTEKKRLQVKGYG